MERGDEGKGQWAVDQAAVRAAAQEVKREAEETREQEIRWALVERVTKGWPHPLVKAVMDTMWTYAVGLRTGQILTFTRVAEPDLKAGQPAEWACLENVTVVRGEIGTEDVGTTRGCWVRVADIVWALDQDS